MKDIWIKIGLPGADPQLGTLQGRVTEESFDQSWSESDLRAPLEAQVNEAIKSHTPFRLFDPIIFRPQRGPTGDVMLGALPLVPSMPPIEGKYININPANIVWWGILAKTADWDQIATSTLTGLDLAGGNLKL